MGKEKILIVDDEINITISLEFLMKKMGYETLVAHDGAQALEKVAGYRPDLILLDVMMPKISGFDVCERIRANPEYEDIKIIMLTAKGREVEVTKGLALGANEYIIKPFSTKELVQRIEQILAEST